MERPKLYWLIPLLLIIAGGLLLTRIRFGPVVNLRLQGPPIQSVKFVVDRMSAEGCWLIAPDGSLWFVGKLYDICIRKPLRLQIDGLWKDIAFSGNQFVGVRNDGSLWAWGLKLLKDDQSAPLPETPPWKIETPPWRIDVGTNWSTVVCGGNFFLALRDDGALFGMGANSFGVLGQLTERPLSHFTAVATEHRWSQLAVGATSIAGIRTDGTLWAWGKDVAETPTQVGAATNWIEVNARGYVFVAQNANGEVYVWGGNSNHVIDGGQASPLTSLTALPDSQRWSRVWPSETSLMARDKNGQFWCWGLGFPERRRIMGRHDPRQRRPFSMPTQISTTCLVHDELGLVLGWSEDGTLWNRGEILGACEPTVAEKRKAVVVKWLGNIGITTPVLTKWAEPFDYTTNFVPVARFSNP